MSKRSVPLWFDEIIGPFNLFALVGGLAKGILYGDVTPHKISLPHPEGPFWDKYEGAFWNGVMTKRLLGEYGVKVYWFGFNGREVYFHIATRQASWAEYICLRAGVPIQTTYDPRNQLWASRHTGPPPSWKQKREAYQRRMHKTRLYGVVRLVRWFFSK